MSSKKEDNGLSSSPKDHDEESIDDLEDEFLDAEEGEYKDPDYSASNLAFNTADTDENARKIIEGKQLK